MGGSISTQLEECGGCFANVLGGSGTSEDTDAVPLETRLARLRTGSRFLKKAYLGLSSKEVDAKLSEDFTVINWRTVDNGSWMMSTEKGIVNLTMVEDIKCEGDNGLSLHDKAGNILFAGAAETKSTRDLWVTLLQELLDSWKSSPSERPEAKLDAQNVSDKEAYFARRQAELEERKRAREEKRAKYAGVGLKYTAQAMSK